MNNQPIGILDSGFGGLHIWRELTRQLPYESITYIGDSLYCPYGVKKSIEVYKLALRLVQFLIQEQKVKVILIACNTVTVSCLEGLRINFPNIPIIGIVPVVKTAVEKTKNGRIGILSTQATAKSAYQQHLIDTFARNCYVVNKGASRLVPFVERGEITGKKLHEVLKKVLGIFKQEEVDTLALGCSHFPFLKEEIVNIMGKNVLLLDSAGAVTRQVKRVLAQNNHVSPQNKKPLYTFYTTGDAVYFETVAKKLLGESFVKKVTGVEAVKLKVI